MNKRISLIIVFLISINVCGRASGNMATCSAPYKWNIKASVSCFKSWMVDFPFMASGDFETVEPILRSNFQVEADFDFCKYADVGLFGGFLHYDYANYDESGDYMLVYQSFAPVFGASLHLHVLPMFISSPCRWDLYLSTQYSGYWLPHVEMPDWGAFFTHYRQTYGIGIGLAYYFKNIAGLFGEYHIGQYSTSPKLVDCHYNVRFGVCFKL